MSDEAPRVLDLFSGIGGFSLGLERAGMRTVAFCEIDPYCRAVLAKHWPNVPCYDDVRTLTAERLAADGIVPDVICGGFPCQDISVAGKGAGLAGERSGLWFEYARLIGELRPRYVIVENVAALLGRGLGTVLGDLAALGYDAEWHCIPASAVGAPHRRDRLWLVAYPERRGLQACGAERDGHDGEIRSGGEHPRHIQAAEDASRDMAHSAVDGWLTRRASDAPQGPRGRQLGRGGVSENICDAYGPRLAIGQSLGSDDGEERAPIIRTDWWHSEPDVGRDPDGFPWWLDRFIGSGMSHEESVRAVEELRRLWSPALSQALWRAAGGLERLSQAEVLFAFVRQYQGGVNEARLLVAGAKAHEDFLRGLRRRGEARSAPRQPKARRQSTGEHPDPVLPVPRLLAHDSQADWPAHSWEDAVPRIANGVPSRVDRLRSLGNAVVPQIPEAIGRAIMTTWPRVRGHAADGTSSMTGRDQHYMRNCGADMERDYPEIDAAIAKAERARPA